jgi:hypothetical protein
MMVGIVGILLLGSLAWSAVGALFSAFGEAASALSSQAPPPATLAPAVAATPTVNSEPRTEVTVQTTTPVGVAATSEPTNVVVATPVVVPPTSTPGPTGRNPWILLPQPAPGSKVQPGPLTLEARGRGDAPITAIHIELDGSSLPVSLEQRSDSTWRGFATTRVTPGQHAARAVVTDSVGRSGSYRWSFSVGS